MRAEQHRVVALWLDGISVDVRVADLVIVEHDGTTMTDFELVARVEVALALEQRLFDLDMMTSETIRFSGAAALVRTVGPTIVFRGAVIERHEGVHPIGR